MIKTIRSHLAFQMSPSGHILVSRASTVRFSSRQHMSAAPRRCANLPLPSQLYALLHCCPTSGRKKKSRGAGKGVPQSAQGNMCISLGTQEAPAPSLRFSAAQWPPNPIRGPAPLPRTARIATWMLPGAWDFPGLQPKRTSHTLKWHELFNSPPQKRKIETDVGTHEEQNLCYEPKTSPR